MKQERWKKSKTGYVVVSMCLILMVILGGCQNKETDGEAGNPAKKEQTESISKEEFISQYMTRGMNEVEIMSGENRVINGVEVSEATTASKDINTEWMGFSEVELGLLSPEEMPNCRETDPDPFGQVIHWIYYNELIYCYVNDYIRVLEKSIAEYGVYDTMGPILEQYKQYANVWCTSDSDIENIKVLGGLEDYGRACAKAGGNEK